MGLDDSAWLGTHADSAVRDLFEACATSLDATPVAGPDGAAVAGQLAEARAMLADAQRGDWQGLERHLCELGARCARDGLASSAWYASVDALYRAVMPRLVQAHAGEPARLTEVLGVLGDHIKRALSVIAAEYDAVKQQRAGDAAAREAAVIAHGAARLEVLAATAHEFAAASGDIDSLLALVARRLGEILGDGCAVRLISDDGAWLEPSQSFYHRDPEGLERARQVLGSERQQLGTGIAGRVAASGAAERIPVIEPATFLAGAPPQFQPMLREIGVASALSVPLRSRERTIGAISLLRSTPGDPYTRDDQWLAQELADRAGLAIDNAVLLDTLERRVAERTAALETANRELEAFSYSASHDLRTPLRAIDGFSRALLADYSDQLDDRAQHYLQRIRAGTQRMSSLIDDLLGLARISRVPLQLEVLDLSAIADDVVGELRKREPARTIEVHVQPGLTARADARLMRILFENLLGNAWKFTAKAPGAAIWFGADGKTWFVRDTGAGFDMAYAEKLFVPFQRLHTVHEFDGIGVGLATVQRIVHHHGGTIWAEGEVGQGATFFFTLGGHA